MKTEYLIIATPDGFDVITASGRLVGHAKTQAQAEAIANDDTVGLWPES